LILLLILQIPVIMERRNNQYFQPWKKRYAERRRSHSKDVVYEHEITKELANSIVNSTKIYISSGKHTELVKNIDEYVQHVSLHISKENQRLFVMADMLLMNRKH
jgi:hemerythrin-like domain-containing protein